MWGSPGFCPGTNFIFPLHAPPIFYFWEIDPLFIWHWNMGINVPFSPCVNVWGQALVFEHFNILLKLCMSYICIVFILSFWFHLLCWKCSINRVELSWCWDKAAPWPGRDICSGRGWWWRCSSRSPHTWLSAAPRSPSWTSSAKHSECSLTQFRH